MEACAVIPDPQKWRQEERECEASLSYIFYIVSQREEEREVSAYSQDRDNGNIREDQSYRYYNTRPQQEGVHIALKSWTNGLCTSES